MSPTHFNSHRTAPSRLREWLETPIDQGQRRYFECFEKQHVHMAQPTSWCSALHLAFSAFTLVASERVLCRPVLRPTANAKWGGTTRDLDVLGCLVLISQFGLASRKINSTLTAAMAVGNIQPIIDVSVFFGITIGTISV